ncbi:hypothetical protein JCM8547_005860 [Rhodosporidiobolus lusitaniae]
MPSPKVRIALCQFSPLNPPSPPSSSPSSADNEQTWSTNLARAHDFVRQAANEGAELVVFPEYFISGIVSHPSSWSLAQQPHHAAPPFPPETHSHEAPSPPSHSESTHWLSTFRSLARELRVDIAVGTIVEHAVDEDGKEKSKEVDMENERGEKVVEMRPVLENVAHYVDWEGNVVGRYAKRNLWWPEKDYLTAGLESHQVFDTRFGRVAFLICWDLASPLSLPSLLLHPSGPPDMIIAPTYWTGSDAGELGLKHNEDSEKEYLESLVKTRSWEGECAMVFCNVGSPSSSSLTPSVAEEQRIGLSQVCVPFKGRIGGAKSDEEELVVVDVELGEVLKDARAVYGVHRDLTRKLQERKERGEELLPGWVAKKE